MALRFVAGLDCLCVLWAMVEWKRLSRFSVQTPVDGFGLGMLYFWLIAIALIGLASGAGLLWLASSSTSKKSGDLYILPGLIAPFLLMLFVLR